MAFDRRNHAPLRQYYHRQLRHIFDISDPSNYYGGAGNHAVRDWCARLLSRVEIIPRDVEMTMHSKKATPGDPADNALASSATTEHNLSIARGFRESAPGEDGNSILQEKAATSSDLVRPRLSFAPHFLELRSGSVWQMEQESARLSVMAEFREGSGELCLSASNESKAQLSPDEPHEFLDMVSLRLQAMGPYKRHVRKCGGKCVPQDREFGQAQMVWFQHTLDPRFELSCIFDQPLADKVDDRSSSSPCSSSVKAIGRWFVNFRDSPDHVRPVGLRTEAFVVQARRSSALSGPLNHTLKGPHQLKWEIRDRFHQWSLMRSRDEPASDFAGERGSCYFHEPGGSTVNLASFDTDKESFIVTPWLRNSQEGRAVSVKAALYRIQMGRAVPQDLACIRQGASD